MIEVARALRTAEAIEDERFDRLYPPDAHALAERRRRYRTCRPPTRRRGPWRPALATDAGFVGVEQRPHLVDSATALATSLGAQRARFVSGDVFALDWREFDAIYLYNPFQEHVGDDAGVIDRTISIGPRHHADAVQRTRAKLAEARIGTRVVTYYGFGGRMPLSYRRVHKERCAGDWLELWVKEPAWQHRQRPDC